MVLGGVGRSSQKKFSDVIFANIQKFYLTYHNFTQKPNIFFQKYFFPHKYCIVIFPNSLSYALRIT
jgi:hypothetical protein